MQPILVRPLPPALAAGNHWGADGGNAPSPRHELIAGERRWRACQIAGIPLIPALVRDVSDLQAAELALIENLQRQDLSAIERAHAFARLANEFALSHEQIAQRVGSDRSTISNTLRLLLLPESVQHLVLEGKLSAGQARALASISDPQRQHDLAITAINQAWSVRQLEAAAKKLATQSDARPASDTVTSQRSEELTTPSRRTAQLADLEAQLTAQLNTPVHVRPGKRKGSGTLAIEFYSVDQFDALLARLQVTTEG
jgi:ParB family transcriptional regulator, chromosome partitioning protein